MPGLMEQANRLDPESLIYESPLAGRKKKQEKLYQPLPHPFVLPEPSIISFSGGRTSGMMLRCILDEHRRRYTGTEHEPMPPGVPTLPPYVKVLFCNTGRERPETLDFIHECEVRWRVPVVWLEWRDGGEGRTAFEIVDYETADRDGEVFRKMLVRDDIHRNPAKGKKPGDPEYYSPSIGRKPLPNPVSRHCTASLKIRTKMAYVRQVLKWPTFHNAVGFRFDEKNRVNRAPNNAERGETICAPLHDAGITEADVMMFWEQRSFDLHLKSYEGNCDLCFMKSRLKINTIMREHPELAYWWIDREDEAQASDRPTYFRNGRPNYRQMLQAVQSNSAVDYGDMDEEMACASHGCTD